MKKYLSLLFLMCFFTFACKKKHDPVPDPVQKVYKANFNLTGFTQSIAGVSNGKQHVNSVGTNAAPVPVTTDYFKVIKYLVYDANGNLFHSLTIDSTASNFGNISDNLPAGTYTIGIAAGQAGLTYNKDLNNVFYYASSMGSSLPWGDTFFNKSQLTVSGDVTRDVTLSRIVGQLEINIEDAIPAVAKSIDITIKNEYSYYSFANELPNSGSPEAFTTIIPEASKGKTNFKINKIIANTVAPFVVTITCYDANQKNIGQGAVINNVTCQKNTRTILSGKLFNGLSNNTFIINLNNNWDPTPIVIHY
ncbi:FimB/Mfa2 family fimbrial subunit [Mucilaginibacter angelicae]|uniref:FimB/Mfa2 family fimbrial subunit n=1 Tax=Mucilaginibacter angelicae TaxID=869718 RepID=A0ABV6LDF0_9SPHI